MPLKMNYFNLLISQMSRVRSREVESIMHSFWFPQSSAKPRSYNIQTMILPRLNLQSLGFIFVRIWWFFGINLIFLVSPSSQNLSSCVRRAGPIWQVSAVEFSQAWLVMPAATPAAVPHVPSLPGDTPVPRLLSTPSSHLAPGMIHTLRKPPGIPLHTPKSYCLSSYPRP